MTTNAPTKAELRALARENEAATLKLDTANKEAAVKALTTQVPQTALEGYYDPDNVVNLRDYLQSGPSAMPSAMPTTRQDRDQGSNWPFFRTESELAVIRGAARLIAGSHPVGVGVLNALTNYVMGTGFKYSIKPKRRNSATDPVVRRICATAQHVIEAFQEANHWSGDFDRELFQRRRVDGEYFVGLWSDGNGQTRARAIEPDQVTEPSGRRDIETSGWLRSSEGDEFRGDQFASDWTFGIHSDDHDSQNIHGVYVQWSDRDLDWDYLPSGLAPLYPPQANGVWCEHAKANVVRSVKRGLSDFFCVHQGLELSRKILRNVGSGASIQAAIAWIKETVPGTTQAQALGQVSSAADYSYSTTRSSGGDRTNHVQHYDPGTILTPAPGMKYTPGPLGSQTQPNYIMVADAILRSFVATRWNMPEHIVTGSAENNNYASSLVAESPFVKNCQAAQHSEVQQHKSIFWRVIYFAWLAGAFEDDLPWLTLRQTIELLIVPPQIETRDPVQETQVRQILHQAGAMSLTTWQQEEELDPEQERANFAHERRLDRQDQLRTHQPGAGIVQLPQ